MVTNKKGVNKNGQSCLKTLFYQLLKMSYLNSRISQILLIFLRNSIPHMIGQYISNSSKIWVKKIKKIVITNSPISNSSLIELRN